MSMSRLSSVIGLGLLAVAAAAPQAQAASAVVPACAVYEDCGQWANTTQFPPFTLFNNIWGTGAGAQCLWACSATNWGVWADHPATSGVKSYPNVGRNGFQHQVDSMPAVSSSFSVTVPSSGWAGTASYDIWQGGQIEIMLWMNQFGGHGPWAHQWDASGAAIPDATNVSVGGHTWNVYFNGQAQGAQQVWSLIRTSNSSSGTVDIRAILQWLRTGLGGTMNLRNVVIDNYQFGFEISQSPGGQNFTINNYSLTVGGATSTPTSTPTARPTPTATPTATPTTRPTATPTNATPTPTTPSGSTVYQAESSTLAGGVVVESNHAGFNGTGFVNFPANGGSATFNNVSGSGGSATVAIRFALGATGSRTGQLQVNGGTAQNITFNSTGAWATWQTQNVTVTLMSGTGNTIRLASTGADLANVDQITVSGGSTSTPTPTATPTTRPTATPTNATPTPTSATPTPTTGGAACANPTTVAMPITIDGVGDFCRFTTGTISTINSWATTSVTINGVSFTNMWSNTLPARVDGGYYIRYVGAYPWSHFEAR